MKSRKQYIKESVFLLGQMKSLAGPRKVVFIYHYCCIFKAVIIFKFKIKFLDEYIEESESSTTSQFRGLDVCPFVYYTLLLFYCLIFSIMNSLALLRLHCTSYARPLF